MTHPALARASTVAVLVFALAGCASKPVQLYEGPARPANEVATLVTISVSRASVYAIDGKRQSGLTFELLPGQHDVWSHVREQAGGGDYMTFVQMYCHFFTELEAGHRYELRSVNEQVKGLANKAQVKIGAQIIDSGTPRVIRVVGCMAAAPDFEE